MSEDRLYEVVKEASKGFCAVYKDYLVELVGEDGFETLKMRGLVRSCGSYNHRELYTVVQKEIYI